MTSSSPRPSPATAASTCSASPSSATSNSTAATPSSPSRAAHISTRGGQHHQSGWGQVKPPEPQPGEPLPGYPKRSCGLLRAEQFRNNLHAHDWPIRQADLAGSVQDKLLAVDSCLRGGVDRGHGFGLDDNYPSRPVSRLSRSLAAVHGKDP